MLIIVQMLDTVHNDIVIRDRDRPVLIWIKSSQKELFPLTDGVDRRTPIISDHAEDSVPVGPFLCRFYRPRTTALCFPPRSQNPVATQRPLALSLRDTRH